MITAVTFAQVFPYSSASGGAWHPELINKISVASIFFLNVVSLNFSSTKVGALRGPGHAVVQAMTLVVFSLVWIALGARPKDIAEAGCRIILPALGAVGGVVGGGGGRMIACG